MQLAPMACMGVNQAMMGRSFWRGSIAWAAGMTCFQGARAESQTPLGHSLYNPFSRPRDHEHTAR